MNIDEIKQAIGGPNPQPARPEGPSEVAPLSTGGLDRYGAEQAPANVSAEQGAGSDNVLTPGAQGDPGAGTPQPGAGDGYADQGGPAILPASSGLGALTPDPSSGRPEGGPEGHSEPGGGPDPRLGAGGGTGQGINPMLKPAGAPKSSGLFGKSTL
jgi:hypothetical protein